MAPILSGPVLQAEPVIDVQRGLEPEPTGARARARLQCSSKRVPRGTRRGPESCKPCMSWRALHDLTPAIARIPGSATPFGRLGVRGSQVRILSSRQKAPECQPCGRYFRHERYMQWTDEDSARVVFEMLSADHPSRVAKAFNDLFHQDDLLTSVLEMFVTPEARADWGDFSDGKRFFLDLAIAISTRALRPKEANDVAYVKLVSDTGAYLAEQPRQDVIAYVTFVWRPELREWRIHSIGQPAPPHLLPRTDLGDAAPRYESDVEFSMESKR